ncbi:MAG: transposase, partial [Pseudomonadales bacterium]|nr:transposase [Pseudomonadales bacterium]
MLSVDRLVLESDHSIPQIAKDLDIDAGNLRRWVRDFRSRGEGPGQLSRDDAAE